MVVHDVWFMTGINTLLAAASDLFWGKVFFCLPALINACQMAYISYWWSVLPRYHSVLPLVYGCARKKSEPYDPVLATTLWLFNIAMDNHHF